MLTESLTANISLARLQRPLRKPQDLIWPASISTRAGTDYISKVRIDLFFLFETRFCYSIDRAMAPLSLLSPPRKSVALAEWRQARVIRDQGLVHDQLPFPVGLRNPAVSLINVPKPATSWP